MRLRAALSVAFLGLTIPVHAVAQEAISGQAIMTHATFENVGISVTIAGDEDGDATATLEVDANGSGYRSAHRLSRAAPDRFVGSAIFLAEGTPYQVRVTLSDPDGVTGGELVASGSTRSMLVPTSSGETIHVAASGSDSTGTGSESAPFASIARGLEAAQAGDTVFVHAGRYHEEVHVPRGGTDGAPITLRAAGDGEVIMDGADPALLDSGMWTDEGDGVYSAASGETRYVAVDGARLWRYESAADLAALTEGTDGGFFFDGARVHVKLPGAVTPAGHEIQVSVLGRALWLEGTPHVVIRDMTFRCYGAETYSQGIMVRDGSHHVWVVDSRFENVMPGIWVKNDVDDLTVMGSEFSDVGLAGFPWQSVKDQGGMESGAIAIDDQYDGQGIVFYRNVVHDSFDGLRICGDQVMNHPNNADVIENVIYHLGDDGIETDGECSNVRIIGNRFEDTLVGVSVAPAVGGPTWVIRNLMVDLANVAPGSDWMTRAMKFNVGDSRPSGEIFAYHNTGVTYEAEQPAFGVTDDSRWTSVHLRNNIWVGTDHAFYYVNGGDEPFVQDYDLLHSTGARLVYYQEAHYDTIDAYFQGTGQCEHCVASEAGFVDALGGDYAILETSAAVDRGVAIPGVNDGYAGSAPDIGAYELGGEGPSLPDAGAGGAGGSGVGGNGGGTGGGSGVGGGGGGGAGGSGATSGPGASEGDDGGCGCRLVSSTTRDSREWVAALLLSFVLACRRRSDKLAS